MLKIDYNWITQPGGIYAVRVPGIYTDIANTENVIMNTDVSNCVVSQLRASLLLWRQHGENQEP